MLKREKKFWAVQAASEGLHHMHAPKAGSNSSSPRKPASEYLSFADGREVLPAGYKR